MGFLDFLKKGNKPPAKPSPTEAPPAPPAYDTPPEDVNLDEVRKKIGLDKPEPSEWDKPLDSGPSRTDLHPDNPVPTASMMTTPIQREPIPEELDKNEGPEDIPIPPPSMQDPDFLTSAADDLHHPESSTPQETEKIFKEFEEKEKPSPFDTEIEAPPKPTESSPFEEPPSKPEKPVEKPPKKAIESLELPDFTDEDIASLEEEPAEEPVESYDHPSPGLKEPPHIEEAEEFHDDLKPLHEHIPFGKLKPAMFISSDSHFMVVDEIRDARKILRDNDELIRDATLRHEKADDKISRVAVDINTIQEKFMELDEALFEG